MDKPEPFKEPADLKELAFRMRQGFRLFRPGAMDAPEIQSQPPQKPSFKKRIKDFLFFPWKIIRARLESLMEEKLHETRRQLDAANQRIQVLEFRLEALEIQKAKAEAELENRQQQRLAH